MFQRQIIAAAAALFITTAFLFSLEQSAANGQRWAAPVAQAATAAPSTILKESRS